MSNDTDRHDRLRALTLLTMLEDGRDAGVIGREHLRTPSHGIVPGWLIISGPDRDFTVTPPFFKGSLQLDRYKLVRLLREEWMKPARAIVDGAVPAARKAGGAR